MKIAVRLDDITSEMDWDKFNEFKNLLDQYEIKPLIGVVPYNEDDNLCKNQPSTTFWKYVKDLQAKGWVVALHGYHHVYSTKSGGIFPLNDFSEFAGIAYDKQYEMLKAGKKKLSSEGIETDFFMAPAHSYDKNTLKALVALGFTRITDGFGSLPYQWKNLTFYPISFQMSSSLKKQSGYTTMVVHTNTIDDMEYYEKMFEFHKEKFISYEEYLQAPIKKRRVLKQVIEYGMAKLKFMLVKLKSR